MANILSISSGSKSHIKLSANTSTHINPRIITPQQESGEVLSQNSIYTEVSTGPQTVRVDSEIINQSARINPGSVIIIGRSPYIDKTTGTWFIYDESAKGYVDTGVHASGDNFIRNTSNDFYVTDGTLFLDSENTIEELGLGLSTYSAINRLF